MYTLRIPGCGTAVTSWEGNGLRIAVGIGGSVFFANVRHDYKVIVMLTYNFVLMFDLYSGAISLTH